MKTSASAVSFFIYGFFGFSTGAGGGGFEIHRLGRSSGLSGGKSFRASIIFTSAPELR